MGKKEATRLDTLQNTFGVLYLLSAAAVYISRSATHQESMIPSAMHLHLGSLANRISDSGMNASVFV